jgi:outer membrane protein assembly factor BamB
MTAWNPVVVADRVFVVRQSGGVVFGAAPVGAPNDSPIFALDVTTGATVWRADLPYGSGQWTAWLLGHSNGRVYAARSGNNGNSSARVYALDASTGSTVWMSNATTTAGPYDGCVFADNGDLILGTFQQLLRVRATDGATVWSANRTGSVSGYCGAARFGDAVYVADWAPGGLVVKRFHAGTGAFQYQSPVIPGGANQHHPMCGPDGAVYLNIAANGGVNNRFHAFIDSGSALVPRWSLPSLPGVRGEYACSPEGDSVYFVGPGDLITRADAYSGAILNTYPVANGAVSAPRFAIDADGRVFVCCGSAASGSLHALERDLTPRWSTVVPNVHIGGPALGGDGTLVVAGAGSQMRVYRTPSPWTGLGGGIAGGLGEPTLAGIGSLTAGNQVTLRAANAAPNSLGVFLLGASALNLPFAGGILVPSLDVTLAVSLDAQGRWSFGFPWPVGMPSGAAFWWQLAVLDGTAISGIAASDGLRCIAP